MLTNPHVTNPAIRDHNLSVTQLGSIRVRRAAFARVASFFQDMETAGVEAFINANGVLDLRMAGEPEQSAEMADMLATLKGTRDVHIGDMAIGAEYCLGMEVVRANEYLAALPFRAWVHGNEDASPNSVFDLFIKAWWLPAYGAEAATVRQYDPTNKGGGKIMQLYDTLVPKTDATAPDTAYSRVATDNELAEADSNPYWRRDRLSLRVFEDIDQPRSFHTEVITLGWPDGSAYRTGSGTNVKVIKKVTGTIATGVRSPINGYVVLIGYIPPQLDQDDFGGSSGYAHMTPSNNDFDDLSFLAPKRDPILGLHDVGAFTMDEYRRWAVKMVSNKAQDDGTRMDKPTKLNVRFQYDAIVPRVERGETGMVSPNPA